jgi:putative FmdB family regulatory protein
MPRYPYRCKGCGHELEVFQKMSDAKLTACPACHEETLERLILGGTGYFFRGGALGEKGDDYKEKTRGEIAIRDPEKFDRIVEKERARKPPRKPAP